MDENKNEGRRLKHICQLTPGHPGVRGFAAINRTSPKQLIEDWAAHLSFCPDDAAELFGKIERLSDEIHEIVNECVAKSLETVDGASGEFLIRKGDLYVKLIVGADVGWTFLWQEALIFSSRQNAIDAALTLNRSEGLCVLPRDAIESEEEYGS